MGRKLRHAYGVGGPLIPVMPAPLLAERAPTTSDTDYPVGFIWVDQSVNPDVVYFHTGGGIWETGGNAAATTTTAGIVELSTLAELQTGTAPAGAVPTSNDVSTVIAGVVAGAVPPATEIQAGIAELATQAETDTGTDDTRIVTPLKLANFVGAGGFAGSFTTLDASGAVTFASTGAIEMTSDTASFFDVTGAGVDLTLSSDAGRVIINGEEAADNAITLVSAAGGVDIDSALQVNIASSENAVDAIRIVASAGGIDIDAVGAATEDINITNTGGSVVIAATENVADAITLNASAGGIDILAAGGAAEDIDITNTAGSIRFTSGEAVADSMVFASSGGIDADAVGQVNIASSQNAADAIVIISSAGGVDITATGTAGEDLDLLASGSSINLTATENAAQAIYIRANGGTSETIDIHSDQGTGAASVVVRSDVGGVTVQSGLASADAINLNASNAGGGIDIDSGTAGIIADTTGAISLDGAAASNFTVTGAGIDLSLISTSGRVIVNGEEAAADALTLLSAAGGIDANAALQINIDSSQAAAADSVRIVASAADGGIDIDSGTGGTAIDSTGAVSIQGAGASDFSVSGAGIDLSLASAAGRVIVNGEEAADNALTLLSAAGGLDANVALQMNLDSSEAAVDAVRLVASNAAGGIDVDAGTGGIAIDTTGAVSIDSAAASNVTVTGAGLDLTLSSVGGSVAIASDEAVATAVSITASDAAGGVTISAGTGDVNVSGDLNLSDVATKLSYNGGAATDFIGTGVLTAGTQTISNTNIAATDRIFLSRTAVNASTAMGALTYTISAGASFTVTSVDLASPGSTETGDVSSYAYVIIGQN